MLVITFPVSNKVCEVAERFLKGESLTRREREFVEGLLDGTWRRTPDGSFVFSGKEKHSQPSAVSSKPGLEAPRTYKKKAFSKVFKRAKMKARMVDEAKDENPIKREIRDFIIAGMLGMMTGILLVAGVAANML